MYIMYYKHMNGLYTSVLLQGSECSKEEKGGHISMDELEERDNMLENLLVILNSAAAVGVGPSPLEFIKQDELIYRTKSRENTFPGSGKGFQKG